MTDTREKDTNWRVRGADGQLYVNTGGAQLAVLMDIRDELKHLNATLDCQNFQRIPTTLRSILRKLPAPKR